MIPRPSGLITCGHQKLSRKLCSEFQPVEVDNPQRRHRQVLQDYQTRLNRG
jgi:hypothetical protein